MFYHYISGGVFVTSKRYKMICEGGWSRRRNI